MIRKLGAIHHIARADFLERSRSYSFVLVLGLAFFLGYQVAFGNLVFQLGEYRGEMNSVWIGATTSIVAAFFLGWFGFYVVRGSIARDRKTGVGQIMAATSMTRPQYLLGKWMSNLVVLAATVVAFGIAGIILLVWNGASYSSLSAFFAPLLFIVVPLASWVAAVAILFDTVPLLRGGFGNVIYFISFVLGNMGKERSIYEPTGIGLLQSSMSKAALAVYPNYDGSFSLGSTEHVFVFPWSGIHWTPDLVLMRFAYFGLALGMVFIATLFFDRFDRPNQTRQKIKIASKPDLQPDTSTSTVFHLTPLSASAKRYGFASVLSAELRLLLKGQRWWWYLGALAFIVLGFNGSVQDARESILPIACAWPVLIWSSLGNHEARYDTQRMVFSSAFPLWRQLPAQWLAGFIFTLMIGSGAALLFILNGDMNATLSWLAGALFIPSLALALGVWSGNKKIFEIVYLSIWLMGPATNNIIILDFLNSSGKANPLVFFLLSPALIIFAFWGRARQLR